MFFQGCPFSVSLCFRIVVMFCPCSFASQSFVGVCLRVSSPPFLDQTRSLILDHPTQNQFTTERAERFGSILSLPSVFASVPWPSLSWISRNSPLSLRCSVLVCLCPYVAPSSLHGTRLGITFSQSRLISASGSCLHCIKCWIHPSTSLTSVRVVMVVCSCCLGRWSKTCDSFQITIYKVYRKKCGMWKGPERRGRERARMDREDERKKKGKRKSKEKVNLRGNEQRSDCSMQNNRSSSSPHQWVHVVDLPSIQREWSRMIGGTSMSQLWDVDEHMTGDERGEGMIVRWEGQQVKMCRLEVMSNCECAYSVGWWNVS